jgi:deazaflavin-dependent oxidoreductase (nitroreductase family)
VTEPGQRRYIAPDWFTRNIFNRIVHGISALGISIVGSRVLAVRGRKSGEWRTNPVNLLVIGGRRYLLAPRGETDWVRNLRVAGEGELRLGRKVERFSATELPDEEKPDLLREYLRRWAIESGVFFEGVKANAPEDEMRRIAPNHPVFRIESQ